MSTDPNAELVTCDHCEATSESGWGDTALCLDCECQTNVCDRHERTFLDVCPLCEDDGSPCCRAVVTSGDWTMHEPGCYREAL